MDLNEQQIRALAVLDRLLFIEADIYKKARKALMAGGTAKKIRNRVKDDLAFLPSALQKPAWNEKLEAWASDWCEGWAIKPPHNFADALGVRLTKRFKTRPILDEHGEKVPQTDENGEIKLGQNGQPLYKSWKQPYFIWTQATNFSFGTGHLIHTFPLEHRENSWGEQVPRNLFSIQIEEATPAVAVDEAIGRDPGSVRFRLHGKRNGKMLPDMCHETTQDGFVRFLITGHLDHV